ncbi:MAG: hypothetical protein JW760_12170 [Spirochaetales bacterium]|nr:hypothetical protein [Spirochaetales bacterium]
MKTAGYFILGLLLFSPFPAAGQEIAPEEPDLILPPRIIEVEELRVEQVDAFIPPDENLDLLPLVVDFPEAPDIILPEEAFILTIPGDMVGGGASIPGSSDFFSEITLGLGTQSRFLGDITLFMLGREPRTKLRFQHDGRDGFGNHASGTGYRTRKELFEGDVAFSPGIYDIDTGGLFSEEEFGLQGLPQDYSSLLHRRINGRVRLEAPLKERWTLGGSGNLIFSDVVLAGAVPLRGMEIDGNVSASLSLDTRFLRLSAVTGYRFLDWVGSEPPAHLLTGDIKAESRFPFPLDLTAQGGVSWIFGESAAFPFSLTAGAYLGGFAGIFLSGGYSRELLSYGDLLGRFFLTDFLNDAGSLVRPREEAGWFVDSEIRYEPSDRWKMNLQCTWRYADSFFDLGPVSERGLLSQSWYGGVPTSLLRLSGGVSFRLLDFLLLEVDTGGRLSGAETVFPLFDFSAALEAVDPEGVFGASAGFAFSRWEGENAPPVLPPLFSMEGFFKIGEGVSLILEIEDLFAAFSSTPAYGWGGYERPGFALVLKTQLSL